MRQNRKKVRLRPEQLLGLLILAGLWSILTACNGPDNEVSSLVRIGLIVENNASGEQMRQAANLAIDEINNQEGVSAGQTNFQFELVTAEYDGTQEGAARAIRQLINNERVVAVVGPPYSNAAMPAAGFAEEAMIPMISPASTNNRITNGKNFVFRATFADDRQGPALARFALEELGGGRIAVLYNDADPYSHDLADIFRQTIEAAGGEIVAFELYTDWQNIDQQMARIQESRPAVLFLPNPTNELLFQGDKIAEHNITATLLGSDLWDGEQLLNNSAFDGSYYSSHCSRSCYSDNSEQLESFIQRYRERYSQEPNDLATLTYDSLGLIFAAIAQQEKAGPKDIRDGLYNIQFEGVTGPIAFTDSGDPPKEVAIWRIQNGERRCYRIMTP